MNQPTQAVVFCGGLGTRLRPLTDTLPKPMAPVNGKPFLEHLLQQLAEQGCTRFLLLTGYLGQKIRDYFTDGSARGWEIDYSQGPAEWETGRRLWQAREQLDSRFLLLYSDNFVQFRLPELMALHRRERVALTLLLAPKPNGNIRVSPAGRIEAYIKTRVGHDLDYVEVGYMVVERDSILALFSTETAFRDASFSEVLRSLAAGQRLAGLIVHDPYHSISDPARLDLMREYLRVKRILLVDRDGTINEKAPRGEYVDAWSRFRWIKETRVALSELAHDGFKFIVITNQAGIARKMIEPAALDDIHERMTAELAAAGVDVLKIYVSPHHWDENSFMRKPAPGMFFEASKEFLLRMDRSLYIGDDERDCTAALNAGCGMVFVGRKAATAAFERPPQPLLRAETLLQKVNDIKRIYRDWEQRA